MEPRYLAAEREAVFPNLRKGEYEVTSDEDWSYNCIAFAAVRTDLPWWPTAEDMEGVFWPAGVPREETLESFLLAFGIAGYIPCAGPDLEPGFEKIALYADADGKTSHAARQLPSGSWTSKLGDWEDIEHRTLAALEGEPATKPAYGKVVCYMKRPLPQPTAPAAAESV
jgi:hypothetical protein